MTTPLPPLYARWVDAALGQPLPDERRATCARCAMCPSDDDPDAPLPGEHAFHPGVKCCSYTPALPNFLVGRILADTSPEGAAGRARVLERIRGRIGATPLGLGPSRDAQDRYEAGCRDGRFGRDVDLLCPYFDGAEGGLCTIWRHRESTCATYFCRFVDGAAGAASWAEIRQLLSGVERELADRCLLRLGLNEGALQELYDDRARPRSLARGELRGGVAPDGRIAPGLARRIWGAWHGREESFYLACAAWVDALDWDAVRDLCGAALEVQLRRLRTALARPSALARAEVLVLSSVEALELEDGRLSVRAADNAYDPLRMTADAFEALSAFDGRPTAEVLAALREQEIEVDAAWLDALVHRGILLRPDACDPPFDPAPRPLAPDDWLHLLRGYGGLQVRATETTDADGNACLVIDSGAKEITFDEADLLPFGRGLIAHQNGFRAEDATTWRPDGAPYPWPQVRELLEALLAERVLVRAPRA